MTKKDLINHFYKIENLLDIKNISKNISCPNPEHVDKSPSAHIYENRVWCFTCSRFYYVWDIIELWGLDYHKLFDELIEEYGSLEAMKELYNENAKLKKNVNVEKIDIKKGEDFISFTKRFFNEQ